jgi:hypothetical protein
MLGGDSKQTSTYKYAGFQQLISISSGIIRFFLDPAAKMFAEEHKKQLDKKILQISPSVQDDQIRKQSDDLLLKDFERLQQDYPIANNGSLNDVEKLKNLINGIGYTFQAYLLDEHASQRRCFSFFIPDEPPQELRSILNLGVHHGYLYKESIGKKEGYGRTTLYVLTRRLAPAFKLDPNGFSNYLSMTSKDLLSLIQNPRSFNKRLKNNTDSAQLSFDLVERESL